MRALLDGETLAEVRRLSGYVASRRDRRIIAFGSLGGCCAGIVGLVLWGRDTELHRLALNGFFWLAAAIVFAFILGGQMQRRTAADAAKALVGVRHDGPPVAGAAEARTAEANRPC
jgi:hypothetical protein